METKKQLLEQYTEFAAKYMEAETRIRELLAPFEALDKSEDSSALIPTKESLFAFERAIRDANRALEKLHKIMEKLYKLR